MKKLLPLVTLAALFACNNTDTEQAKGIDSSQGSHHTSATMDTANSMKQLMEQNMQQMMGVRSSGNADIDFAALMRIHHEGAINMANELLKTGKDETLKKIAQEIITDQQKEIIQFDDKLDNHSEPMNDTVFFNKSMQDMHHMQLTDEKGSIDRQFIQMMIPHHEGAIIMAKAYIQNGARDPTLKRIAANIVKTQQAEINALKQMLPTIK